MVSSNNKRKIIFQRYAAPYRAAITPKTPATPATPMNPVICGAAPSEEEVVWSAADADVLVAVASPCELVKVVVIKDDEALPELDPLAELDPVSLADPEVAVAVALEASEPNELVTDATASLALLRTLPAAPVTFEAMFPPSEVMSAAAPSAPVTAADAMLRPPSTAVEAASLAPWTTLLMESATPSPKESWARTEVEERRRRAVRLLSCMVAVCGCFA